jgi:hypothetical protein
LDIYGHLFNDANFSRQQVKLLEASLPLARVPTEKARLPASSQAYDAGSKPTPLYLEAPADG